MKKKETEVFPDPELQKRTFLAAFETCGNTSVSCKIAGLKTWELRHYRNTDEAFEQDYKEAEAHAGDLLEAEARRRAYEGVVRHKFFKGQIVTMPDPSGATEEIQEMVAVPNGKGDVLRDEKGQPIMVLRTISQPKMVPYIERDFSDTMLMFLLRAVKPDKYGANPLPGDGAAQKTYIEVTRAEFGSETGKPTV